MKQIKEASDKCVDVKIYLCQLEDDVMLVYDGETVKPKSVGYPVPDCRLPYNDSEILGSNNILKALLSYDIKDMVAFKKAMLDLKPVSFLDFKAKVFAEDIGGGCPKRLQTVGRLIQDYKLTELGAYYCSLCPFITNNLDVVELPSDDYLTSHKAMITANWGIFTKVHRYGFQNNMIVYTGVRGVDDINKLSDFIKTLIKCCMDKEKLSRYKYITAFLTERGSGGVVLSDSVIDNVDMSMFYQRISGVDLKDGVVDCDFRDNDIVELTFRCTDKVYEPYYRGRVHKFVGSYYREELR